MRIPIDLIAALLCVDRIGETLAEGDVVFPSPRMMALLWAAFLTGTWLLHELAARLTERRTRYGLLPDGGGTGMHPQQFHSRCTWIAQFLSVSLFAYVTWETKWPAVVLHWPTWIGLSADAQVGGLILKHSKVIQLLTISPYLLATILSWIPRRRLISGGRRKAFPLIPYLVFEAKLSWMPLTLMMAMAVLYDGIQMLPRASTAWLSNDWMQLMLLLAVAVFFITIVMPLLAVKMWRCEPLPDSELKERLRTLLERSGVKARAIVVWGARNTGLLNACLIGPWSRFRYVLISPLLADELSLDETEAVLGHELGHARYGHMKSYFSLTLCMSLLIVPFSTYLERDLRSQPLLQTGFTMALVIGFIYFLFGPLSRQCEREADLASAEYLGTPQPLIAALEKIALRNGNIRRVPCWHHGSIAERISAVLHLSADRSASDKFHTRLRWLRWGLFAVTGLLLVAECLGAF